MMKAVGLIKRKSGVSRKEFFEHYERVHAPLAVKHLPTMRRYVQNHIMPSIPGEEPEFDAMLEVWYDDIEGYQSAIQIWQSQAGEVIRDDEEKFMDRNRILSFVVEEKIIK